MRTERQLAEALSSSAAWREAALAKGGDLQVRRELGTRKASTEAWVAARRAFSSSRLSVVMQAAKSLCCCVDIVSDAFRRQPEGSFQVTPGIPMFRFGTQYLSITFLRKLRQGSTPARIQILS